MTPAEICSKITADPSLLALVTAIPFDSQALATALSTGTTLAPTRMVSARGIAGKYAAGPAAAEVVLMKLEGARDAMLASADATQKVMGSMLRRQLSFLNADGLDFADPALRGMLDQFAALGVITAQEATHLKALGEVPLSVSEYEVRAAIFNDDGTLKV